MFEVVKKYAGLVKFSHTIFAMPFAFIGFYLAVTKTEFDFRWLIFALVILCMVFARNAAMGFNRYLDRDIDVKNERTAKREIPLGIILPEKALMFVVANCLLFVVATWFINPLTFCLSPVALLVVLGYSYTKRFTYFCHFVLSFGLSIAPMGAWMAVTGKWGWLAFAYSSIVFFWVSGFDIIYSLQDTEFDQREKLFSIPSVLGVEGALKFAKIIHSTCIVVLVIAGAFSKFGWMGWTGVVLFTGLLVYQHSIVKPNDLSRVNLAFGTTNGIASVMFAIFTIVDFYQH